VDTEITNPMKKKTERDPGPGPCIGKKKERGGKKLRLLLGKKGPITDPSLKGKKTGARLTCRWQEKKKKAPGRSTGRKKKKRGKRGEDLRGRGGKKKKSLWQNAVSGKMRKNDVPTRDGEKMKTSSPDALT